MTLLRNGIKKKGILVIASTLIALAFFVGAGEAFLRYQYGRWRSDFEKSCEWYGGLTIASKNQTLMWEYRPNGESNHPKVHPKIRTNR